MVQDVLTMDKVLQPIHITRSRENQAFKGYIILKSPNIVKINQDVVLEFIYTVKSFLPG